MTSVYAQKSIEMILQSVQYLKLRALQLFDYPIISTTLCRSLSALCSNDFKHYRVVRFSGLKLLEYSNDLFYMDKRFVSEISFLHVFMMISQSIICLKLNILNSF